MATLCLGVYLVPSFAKILTHLEIKFLSLSYFRGFGIGVISPYRFNKKNLTPVGQRQGKEVIDAFILSSKDFKSNNLTIYKL